jgi:hypothetical protein
MTICVVGCTLGNDCFAWADLAPPPSHTRALMPSPYPRLTLLVLGKSMRYSIWYTLFKPLTVHPAHRVLLSMAPVVRIQPNGSQTLLLFKNARKDLENGGWLLFIQRFEGFNLSVSQQFTLTFDICRAKVGDIKLELNEEFLSSATGKRWPNRQPFPSRLDQTHYRPPFEP